MAIWASEKKKEREAKEKAKAKAEADAKAAWLDAQNQTMAERGLTCIKSPLIGCGGPATSFRDERSVKEYYISQLCQMCQDEVFAPS